MRGENGASGKFSTTGLLDMINHIGNTKEMTMIEIGAYIGESTCIFAENFKSVISIDPHLNYQEIDANIYIDFNIVKEEYLKNISKYDNVTYINKTSNDALSDIIKKVDLVYIDGAHIYEQVKNDILNYIKLVKSGGIVAGHDYKDNLDVTNAVNELLGTPDNVFLDSSWIKNLD
jgi:predicted O-methyltransferase YrrM